MVICHLNLWPKCEKISNSATQVNQQYVTAKEVWNTELLILHIFETNAYDEVILFILTLLCTGYYLSQAFCKRSESKSDVHTQFYQ